MKLVLITEKELCEILKVDRSFLYLCRLNGLPFIRLGKKLIRYELNSVLNWYEQNSEKVVNCFEKESM